MADTRKKPGKPKTAPKAKPKSRYQQLKSSLKDRMDKAIFEALAKAETGGRDAKAYKLSLVTTGKSGYSIGFLQIDLHQRKSNKEVKALVKKIVDGIPAKKFQDLIKAQQKTNSKEAKWKTFTKEKLVKAIFDFHLAKSSKKTKNFWVDPFKKAIDAQIQTAAVKKELDRLTKEDLEKSSSAAKKATKHLKDGKLKDVATIHAADINNQFGGIETFSKFLQGKSVTIGGKTVKPSYKTPDLGDLFRYTQSTKYAAKDKNGFDAMRRLAGTLETVRAMKRGTKMDALITECLEDGKLSKAQISFILGKTGLGVSFQKGDKTGDLYRNLKKDGNKFALDLVKRAVRQEVGNEKLVVDEKTALLYLWMRQTEGKPADKAAFKSYMQKAAGKSGKLEYKQLLEQYLDYARKNKKKADDAAYIMEKVGSKFKKEDIKEFIEGKDKDGKPSKRFEKKKAKDLFDGKIITASAGCNGYNHHPDCNCGFGMPYSAIA